MKMRYINTEKVRDDFDQLYEENPQLGYEALQSSGYEGSAGEAYNHLLYDLAGGPFVKPDRVLELAKILTDLTVEREEPR